MDNKTKKIIAKFVRQQKNKLELLMEFPSATPQEVKKINLFYEVSKEIIVLQKNGEKESTLKKVITKLGYNENDLNIILGKNELEYKIKNILINLVSLLFILAFFSLFGYIFYNTIIQTNWDFLKKDCVVSGIIFGEDTNFSDMQITSSGVIKNVLVNENEYSLIIRCNEKLVLNYSKKGFLPIHKTIECEEQNIDLVFLPINEFVKLDQGVVTKVKDKGVSVDVNGSDLILFKTNESTSTPKLSLTSFNPINPIELSYFPGELGGVRGDGNTTPFELYGFAKIIVVDGNGIELDFKENTKAKITFPIYGEQKEFAPTEISLWYFDETKGVWVEEGSAKKVCENNNCVFVGETNKTNYFLSIAKTISEKEITFNSIKLNLGDANYEFSEKNEYKLVSKNFHLFKEFLLHFNEFSEEKKFTLPITSEEIFVTINNIPSNKINLNELIDSIELNDLSLKNCEYWEQNESKIFSCIKNYDLIMGVSVSEATKFVRESGLDENSKSVLLINLIKYFGVTSECYNLINSSTFFGVRCLKIMDEGKQIDSNQNISNILLQGMSEEKTSIVLTNLAEYYWDKNYCEKIPVSHKKNECVDFFPKEPEIVLPQNLCGNGVVNEGEECDGKEFLGLTCKDFGFSEGELFCVNCKINKSGCYNKYN